ncbi:alpha-N-acetylgalactosaminidase-like [Diabrotica virgifera virgifera]|uniref:Alpha-galactosidase n=1 Tax=Diabrotica virgifera virgifera TaxID=50390 RepID=A0ABM5KUD1_DIAVI|nr:alpha-N-acetylgalactosaminidase-like [Diabrotica virgifera virgifera]
MVSTLVFALVGLISTVNGLDNGLARKPPMGWMHWQRFRCLTNCKLYPDECISEKLFRDMADRMSSDGYLAAGYEYIMIDDCWSSKERDSKGRLVPDPDRFPSGIKNLSDYIHSKGLKFGIYADYGTLTCAGYPGSKDYLKVDADRFAEWKVDYLKFDGCKSNWKFIDKGYIEMGKHLNATGRPIVYSCSWPAYQEYKNMKSNYTAVAETCNLWRNWIDVNDSWQSVTSIIEWFANNQDRLAPFSAPGHWNDPDMLVIGNFGLSFEQSKGQMSVWSVMAAPLIMSVDLRTIEPKFRAILLNKDAIAVNQDPLGEMGRLVLKKDGIYVWKKQLTSKGNGRKRHAIAVLSQRTDGFIYRFEFTLKELNITSPNGFFIKDIFDEGKSVASIKDDEKFVLRMAPTGGTLLVATPKK